MSQLLATAQSFGLRVDHTSSAAPCLLSVILPTRNEAGNIAPLIARLEKALQGMSAEVIFVDDSTDDTPQKICEAGACSSLAIKLIARPPECRAGGLGGAVVEGFRAAHGAWMCVMDADLQHPPEAITKMLSHAQSAGSDLVIGSRFAAGASTPGLDSLRIAISHTFILSARMLFINQLRKVTDPLTGFFLVRSDRINLNQLHPNGFKILLEMIVQFPALKISEVGFVMEPRHSGESKASAREVYRYYRKLMELRMSKGDPRFGRFAAVGITGLIVNSLALAIFTEWFHIFYLISALLATQCSTLWNFLWTERWVFADRRDNRSLGLRLLGFFLLNNVLFFFRGPMISFMVQDLSINYLAANVISIIIATALRFFVADKLLWSPKKTDQAKPVYTGAVKLPATGEIQQMID